MVDDDSKARRGAPLRRGDLVGRYVIIDVSAGEDAAGHGSYAAFDPELDRRVVLKVMPTASLDPDQVLRQRRLQREAQAMARVNHPNVLAVHDVGEHDGQLFVAMEHVEGMTLRAWLAAETRPWRDVLAAFVSAGRGLQAAHDRKLVHRDFTPDNVIVTDDGRICVWGFGSVRATASRSSPGSQERRMSADMVFRTQLTRREDVIGSPAYMAPEQQQGDKVTAAADQFSFCVALYEALFGKHPFAGDTTADRRLAAMQWRVEPPDRSEVSIPIRRAIDRGLAPEPHLRHGSMADLIDVLTRGTQRRRRIIAGLSVVGLAVVVASGWMLHRHNAQQACLAAAASIEELWSDQARATLLDSLERTGSVYAQVAYEQAELELDEFSKAWSSARLDVCQAALDHDVEPEHVRAAVACLDEQAAAVEVQIELLPEITRDYIYTTTAALRRARRPAACLDYHLVARGEARSEAALAAGLEARRLYLRGSIRERRAQYDAAQALFEQAREQAELAGAAAALASAHTGLGLVAHARGDYVGAREQLEIAFEVAVSAGADIEAGEAARLLTGVVGHRLRRPRAALAWAELSAAYFDLAGVPEDSLRRAMLLEEVGIVRQHSDPEQAIENVRRAYELTVAGFGEGHPESARVLNNFANMLLETGRLAEAQAAYERVIARERLLFGRDHPFVADAMHNLGLVLRTRGELDEAEVHLDAALDLRLEILDDNHPALAVSYLGLAQLEAERRDFDAMLQATDRAEAILAQHPPSPERAIVLANAAQSLMQDRPTLARRYAERAKALIVEIDPVDEAGFTTEIQVVIALAEANAGNLDVAKDTAKQALDTALARGAPPERLALCYAALANVHYAAGELSDALRYAELGALDPTALAVLGEVLVLQGDADEAIARIEPRLEEWNGARRMLVAQALRVPLVRARLARGELDEASSLLDEIADAAVYGMPERMAACVDVLWAEVHLRRGELESARRRLDRIAERGAIEHDPATADAIAKLRTVLSGSP